MGVIQPWAIFFKGWNVATRCPGAPTALPGETDQNRALNKNKKKSRKHIQFYVKISYYELTSMTLFWYFFGVDRTNEIIDFFYSGNRQRIQWFYFPNIGFAAPKI